MDLLSSRPPPTERRRKILLVDRSSDRLRLIESFLNRDGYDVLLVEDPDEVLPIAREGVCDLILLEAHMDGDFAFSLCSELRLADALHLTPILLMSPTPPNEEQVVRGLLAGADDFICTERENELLARIRVQIRNRRDRELLQWAQRQRTRLEGAALSDPLTSLSNRRAGDRAVMRALENGGPVMLLMMDLDHFKEINDEHGHAMGDEVLRRVAKVLARRTRKGDTVARYGGEEFIVVIAGAPTNMAHKIGERYRQGVNEIGLGGTNIEGVTISVGVAVWDGSGPRPNRETLLEAADRALYTAKRSGRNRVVVQVAAGHEVRTTDAPEKVL